MIFILFRSSNVMPDLSKFFRVIGRLRWTFLCLSFLVFFKVIAFVCRELRAVTASSYDILLVWLLRIVILNEGAQNNLLKFQWNIPKYGKYGYVTLENVGTLLTSLFGWGGFFRNTDWYSKNLLHVGFIPSLWITGVNVQATFKAGDQSTTTYSILTISGKLSIRDLSKSCWTCFKHIIRWKDESFNFFFTGYAITGSKE